MSATVSHHSGELPPSGLVISATESIRSFLLTASTDPHLSEELRELAADLASLDNVPYKSLRSVWMASSSETRPNLVRLFSGSGFVFTSPKPREKSEELKARLRKLAEIAEKKAYEELVKDIKPKKEVDEPFSSYKDQLGFGPSCDSLWNVPFCLFIKMEDPRRKITCCGYNVYLLFARLFCLQSPV